MLPAIADWQRNSLNVRLATIAICQLDILTEKIINHLNPGVSRQGVILERDRLTTVFSGLGVLRDVHDTHKHGLLTRRSAKITQGQPLEIHSYGGAIGSMPIGAAPIGGTLNELAIELDDGTRFNVPVTISSCVAFWRTEMDRLGV